MMDIVGIDQPCLDHMVLLDKIPETDAQTDMINKCWQGGGRVPTALAAAARLGAKTGLLGRSGADRIGKYLKEELRRDGVDVTHLLLQEGRRADYVVALAERSTHGRSFIGSHGTYDEYRPEDVPDSYVIGAKGILLYRFDEADQHAARLAKAAGAVVACDCDADEYFDSIMENIGLIDVFIASEFAYRALFPKGGDGAKNCQKIREMGPQTVIFTLGKKGCIGLREDGSFFELPAFEVEAVDTTGAGDTFHGAYLYASICEKQGIYEAARFASAVSAIQCMFLGGRAGLPDRRMAEDFLQGKTVDMEELKRREQRCEQFPV